MGIPKIETSYMLDIIIEALHSSLFIAYSVTSQYKTTDKGFNTRNYLTLYQLTGLA